MIRIDNVSLTRNKKKILTNISLEMECGKIYGLVGNNGSGKTMLMKCICGFIHPDTGTITAFGKNIGKDVDYIPHTGIIIETPGFIPFYSGLQNLKVLAGIQNIITIEQVKKSMQQVGLDPDNKLPVKKYSLGMRQRLGLAQAIMEDPSILILDEPTNSLDKHGIKEIHSLLLSLKKRNKLILIASHNNEDIHALCDEIYEMENGQIEFHSQKGTNYNI
ncbi:MAG: ATP-binding cassette domain-containing protein [Lachnospiraceae bacterium]|nr:ATP-binding cassette domain-containing protein [Lachnospiraceae bacterium]MDY4969195.1 ATP-binding cassette domain-containing protein [Lachnospiraceae bacterium]